MPPSLLIPGGAGVVAGDDHVSIVPAEGHTSADVFEVQTVSEAGVSSQWTRASQDSQRQWVFYPPLGRISISARCVRGLVTSDPSPPQPIVVLGTCTSFSILAFGLSSVHLVVLLVLCVLDALRQQPVMSG